MVRIITPTAELKEVMQNICCIKEKTVGFAEKTKRVVIQAEQMDSEVSGLMIGTGCFDRMVFGNLTSGKVREILTEMTEKGYYSFLDQGYVVIDSHKKIPKLNGRPYFLVEKPHWNQPGMGMGMGCGFPQNNCFEDEDDLFLNEDDEEV